MAVDEKKRQAQQATVIAKTIDNIKKRINTLTIAPTGFGKTVIFTELLKALVAENKRVLITQDRVNVGEKNFRKAIKEGMNASLCVDGDFDQSGQVVYGITPTLAKNAVNLDYYHVVIIDECHHASDTRDADETRGYHEKIIAAVVEKNPEALFSSYSATPDRPDGKALRPEIAHADQIHVTYTQALEIGAIVAVKTIEAPLRLRDGETIQSALSDLIDPTNPLASVSSVTTRLENLRPDDFFEQIVRTWRKHADSDREPTFAYVSKVEDSQLLAKAFLEKGYRAAAIHSQQSTKKNNALLDAYQNGEIDILCSVDMLIEGVDQTRTSMILNAKETNSISALRQLVGRGMRSHTEFDQNGEILFDKKTCKHVDLGASTYLHGKLEKHIEVENFIATGEGFHPWKKVQDAKDGKPDVYAVHDGQMTVFAVKLPEQRRYLMLVKQEKLIGAGKKPPLRIISQMAPRTMNHPQLNDFMRKFVAARSRVFVTLNSRASNGKTDMKRIVEQSFEAAADSIQIYYNQHMAATAITTPPPKLRQKMRAGGLGY